MPDPSRQLLEGQWAIPVPSINPDTGEAATRKALSVYGKRVRGNRRRLG